MISAKVRLALRVLLLALLIKNSASGGRFSSGGDAHFPDDDIHGFSDTDTDYQDPSTRREGEKRAAVSPSSTSTTTTTTSEQSEELPKGPRIEWKSALDDFERARHGACLCPRRNEY